VASAQQSSSTWRVYLALVECDISRKVDWKFKEVSMTSSSERLPKDLNATKFIV